MLPILWKTAFLLICSNVFMTFAWYAHLQNLHDKAWHVAALASWGIALFEYILQVPANRLGYGTLNLAQLKIVQEVSTLVGVRTVCRLLHAPAGAERLLLSWLVFTRGGVLYFSCVSVGKRPRAVHNRLAY